MAGKITHTGFKAQIKAQIEASAALKRSLLKQTDLLMQIAAAIVQAIKGGNKVLLFGNGGSAADAQHLAAEFVGKLFLERQPLPALALTTNTSALSAIANDYGYDTVFARQLQALARKGDVVIGISTSGSSKNVLLGMHAARKLGAVTVGFSGSGGELKNVVDYALCIPSEHTPPSRKRISWQGISSAIWWSRKLALINLKW